MYIHHFSRISFTHAFTFIYILLIIQIWMRFCILHCKAEFLNKNMSTSFTELHVLEQNITEKYAYLCDYNKCR